MSLKIYTMAIQLKEWKIQQSTVTMVTGVIRLI